jgi:hypothetical protein
MITDFRHDAAMKILLFSAFALVLAAPAYGGDITPTPPSEAQPETQAQTRPQQTPVRDMDRILQELRDLDSSQDMNGDHVVGEDLC